jgi:hypothetical protein
VTSTSQDVVLLSRSADLNFGTLLPILAPPAIPPGGVFRSGHRLQKPLAAPILGPCPSSAPETRHDPEPAVGAADSSKLHPMSPDRVRWEYIQCVNEMCNRNVSETARRLNMHRRSLQRILAKRAPR